MQMLISKNKLEKLYSRGLSMQEIADRKKWPYHSVRYWMERHNVDRRPHDEAAYIRANPTGDPFHIKEILTVDEQKLYGLGLGIFWGEGNKSSKNAVRLGNSDPNLIKIFREFLLKICGVKREKIKYSLLLFNDANQNNAIGFWARELDIDTKQIGSVTTLAPRGKGTYKKKSMTGVLIIECNNTKLKKWIDQAIANIK